MKTEPDKTIRKKLLDRYFEEVHKFPIGIEHFVQIRDEDSFLRQYRRWKSQ